LAPPAPGAAGPGTRRGDHRPLGAAALAPCKKTPKD
jgi:hypothetical protein